MIAEPVMRRLGIGLAVTLALLTSACAAGQSAQTANQKPTLDGTLADVGNIALRGLAVEAPSGRLPYYPAGSDAQIKLVVVNTGSKADSLTSITSPVAGSWAAFASAADASAFQAAASAGQSSSAAATSSPAPSPSRHHKTRSSGAGASGSSTASGSSSAPASSTPAAPSTSSAAPKPIAKVQIPSGARVSWGVPEAKGTLLLLHLKQRVYPGTTIPITFTFADAGTVTVQVPIALSSQPGSSTVPEPAPTSSIPA